jgi:hypothetical protein
MKTWHVILFPWFLQPKTSQRFIQLPGFNFPHDFSTAVTSMFLSSVYSPTPEQPPLIDLMFHHDFASTVDVNGLRHSPTVRLTKRLTPRKRVAAACAHCKKSRMRCDDVRPCKRCLRSGKDSSCTPSPDMEKECNQNTEKAPIWSTPNEQEFNIHSTASSAFNILAQQSVAFSEFSLETSREYPRLGSYDQACWRRPYPPVFSQFPAFSQFHAMHRHLSLAPAYLQPTEEHSSFPAFDNASTLPYKQPAELQQLHHLQQSSVTSVSLEQQIAHQQEQIRALVARLPPHAALDNLLLSAMLASPSTAPSSQISAALEAAAAAASSTTTNLAARPFTASTSANPAAAGGGAYSATCAGVIQPAPRRAPPALPPLLPPWALPGHGRIGPAGPAPPRRSAPPPAPASARPLS